MLAFVDTAVLATTLRHDFEKHDAAASVRVMVQPPWVTDAATRLLEHLRVHAVDVLVFVQDSTIKAWDEWDAVPDNSYRAGRELVLSVPGAAFTEIERRLAEVQAPLRSAAEAAGFSLPPH